MTDEYLNVYLHNILYYAIIGKTRWQPFSMRANKEIEEAYRCGLLLLLLFNYLTSMDVILCDDEQEWKYIW